METCYHCRDGNHTACVGVSCQCPCPIPVAVERSVEDIQRRCRAVAERFEALAGTARVDSVVSADVLLEAASLLRGYHQSLLLTELDQNRDYRQATAEERAMARGFVALWDSVGPQDTDDWLYTLRNRAELLASLDENDSREAQDSTPSLGPFAS